MSEGGAVVDAPELPESVRDLAASLSLKQIAVVQAVLSGDYPSNGKAYQSVYPDCTENAARANAARMIASDSVFPLYRALRDVQLSERALSRAEAIDILSDMARTSMGDLVEFGTYAGAQDENGEPVQQAVWSFKDSANLTPAQLRSIAELNATKDGLKIKTHDQKAAIRQLSDMGGWDAAKRVKVEGRLAVIDESMSYEEAERIYTENLKDGRDDG